MGAPKRKPTCACTRGEIRVQEARITKGSWAACRAPPLATRPRGGKKSPSEPNFNSAVGGPAHTASQSGSCGRPCRAPSPRPSLHGSSLLRLAFESRLHLSLGSGRCDFAPTKLEAPKRREQPTNCATILRDLFSGDEHLRRGRMDTGALGWSLGKFQGGRFGALQESVSLVTRTQQKKKETSKLLNTLMHQVRQRGFRWRGRFGQ